MTATLFSWIDLVDLETPHKKDDGNLGPIGTVATIRNYDTVELLVDYHDKKRKAECKAYANWLYEKTGTPTNMHICDVFDPTDHEVILAEASRVAKEVTDQAESLEMTFHLSSGTPTMHAVWLLLSKARFPAELVKSSEFGTPEERVQTVELPFEISVDYFPEILKKSDEDLIHLIQSLPKEAPEFDSIIHRCTAMKQAVTKARILASRSMPTLILGETGTGKELFARAIHKASNREGEIITVNCGAIPAELIESELFGHIEGSFTGATADKIGAFEAADGGTVFLDEVGELPLEQQVKLLRVLQEGEVKPIGSPSSRSVDFRLVAATHRNLQEQVRTGEFREDLFHRIAVGILTLPPLREREGDLDPLIDHLWEEIQKEMATQPNHVSRVLLAEARNALKEQKWPGNIRELNNTLTRADLWATSKEIKRSDIENNLLPSLSPQASDGILDKPLSPELDLKALIDEVASHYLQRAHKEAGGNAARAARMLKLSNRNTFNSWLKKHS